MHTDTDELLSTRHHKDFVCRSFLCACGVKLALIEKRMEKMFNPNREKDEHSFFCLTYLVLLSCGFSLKENTRLAFRKVHKDTCLGGDAISPNRSRAICLSSLCFTVVFPKDGVIEWTDRVSKEDETDGEVNVSLPPVHLSVNHWCTVALPVTLWRFGGQRKCG